MKPKPFVELNHFTVPVVMMNAFIAVLIAARESVANDDSVFLKREFVQSAVPIAQQPKLSKKHRGSASRGFKSECQLLVFCTPYRACATIRASLNVARLVSMRVSVDGVLREIDAFLVDEEVILRRVRASASSIQQADRGFGPSNPVDRETCLRNFRKFLRLMALQQTEHRNDQAIDRCPSRVQSL